MAEAEGIEPSPAFTPALFSKQVQQTSIWLTSKIIFVLQTFQLTTDLPEYFYSPTEDQILISNWRFYETHQNRLNI